MIFNTISKLAVLKHFTPLVLCHTKTCPTNQKKNPPICDSPKGSSEEGPKRRERPGKVRMGFIPEEWFLFYHPKTGVTGPYIFGIVVANYLFSKEIYVMEHEFYTALSVVPMMYFAATRLGPELAKSLDKDLDEYSNALEKSRKDELTFYENIVKDAKDAQNRAKGQKMLMDAKKENIAMQLEAIYRERCKEVYVTVTQRMEYQTKLYRASTRIHQKWMLQWILQNVKEAITPEFEKAYLHQAIENVAALASSHSSKN